MSRWLLGSALLFTVVGCHNNPSDPLVLDPPLSGFQLASPAFDVPQGAEVQNCFFFKVPDVNGDGKPFYVDKIEMAQLAGSHHMNVFRQNTVKDLKGPNADGTGAVLSSKASPTDCTPIANCPCFNSANWADWPLVVNSQQPTVEGKNYVLQLPAKVGDKFTPGEILMLQSHFVNATTQKTPTQGEAKANFNQMSDATGVQELGTLFATDQSISICRDNPNPTFTAFCKVNSPNQPITIVAANGHFHSRGTDFTICPWDGMSTAACTTTKFYESTRWDEPPMMTGLNIQVPQGGGISYSCSYQWAPSPACADGCSCLKDPVNCCYKFGGIVESSEHCNAFVYYYPKLNATDITCQ